MQNVPFYVVKKSRCSSSASDESSRSRSFSPDSPDKKSHGKRKQHKSRPKAVAKPRSHESKLKPMDAVSKVPSSSAMPPPLSHQKTISAIESDSFVQQTFISSRSSRLPERVEQPEKEQASSSSNIIPLPETTDDLLGPVFCEDPSVRLHRWRKWLLTFKEERGLLS